MKRAILVTLLTLLCAAPVYSAEIFWEPGDVDTEITDKDFKHKYEGLVPTKSFREMDVYFTPQTTLPEWAEEFMTADQPEGAVAQEREVDVTRPPIVTPPAVRPLTEPRTPRVGPRPSDTSPSTTQSVTPTSRRPRSEPKLIERSVGQPPATEGVDKPSSKKMKWGQVDVKPEEEKGKFQWGQQKQQQ